MSSTSNLPNAKSKNWPLDMFDEAEIMDAVGDSHGSAQMARELKEITALYNVGVVLNSSLNPKEVLWAVYKESSRLLDTANFALAIVDKKRNELNFMLVYQQGQVHQSVAAPFVDPPKLTEYVFRTQTPLLVNNLATSEMTFELSQNFTHNRPASWLAAPISNPVLPQETAQGVIVLWNPKANAFNDRHLWLLSAIGTQASIALRNARQYENSQRRAAEMARLKDIALRQTEEMRFLNEVGRVLASTLHLDKVLTSIMVQVDEMLKVEAGSLLLNDPATGDLVFQIALGEKASEVKPFRVPKGQGIAGQVAQTGEPLIVADVQADKRHFKAVDQKTDFFTRNIMCVPLILHDHVIGVIQVLNKKTGDFTEHDVDLLNSIASYAAIAIENARLYESLEAEHTRSIQAEQEARRKLASDLHDGPTQLVAAVMMNLDFATKALEKDPSLLPGTIKEMQELTSRASHQMRTLLFELRPLVLETQGLGAALQVFLDRRQKDADRLTKLSLKIKTDNPSGDISRQDGKVETSIFAIVQETVNNAIKHAKARNIVVTLTETAESVTVTIADDGAGFNLDEVLNNYDTRGSLGMINLRERAESIGGDFSIESEPGKGTKIVVEISKEETEKERRLKKRTVTGMLTLPANLSNRRE